MDRPGAFNSAPSAQLCRTRQLPLHRVYSRSLGPSTGRLLQPVTIPCPRGAAEQLSRRTHSTRKVRKAMWAELSRMIGLKDVPQCSICLLCQSSCRSTSSVSYCLSLVNGLVVHSLSCKFIKSMDSGQHMPRCVDSRFRLLATCMHMLNSLTTIMMALPCVVLPGSIATVCRSNVWR